MLKKVKQDKTKINALYNYILLLSRNKLFYTKFHLKDTFQNRINLIFIHISFLLNKSKINLDNKFYEIEIIDDNHISLIKRYEINHISWK